MKKLYAAAHIDIDCDVEEITALVLSAANALHDDGAKGLELDETIWDGDSVTVVLAGSIPSKGWS